MIVGIHQPNFIPWMGYFDKMDNSDIFVLLDEVQMSDSDMTQRSRILNVNGTPRYLTVAFNKKGYMKKQLKDVMINPDINWQKRHLDFLSATYGRGQYYEEVMNLLHPIWHESYDRIIDVNIKSIMILKAMLDIDTPLMLQSSIDYNKNSRKSNLVLDICKALSADTYLSGTGARNYIDEEAFRHNNIKLEFQRFYQPQYVQGYSLEFVPGLSMLDILLNCGIDKTRELFKNRIKYI